MLIQPIDYFLVAWFALAAASTGYLAWDQFRNNPEPAVMFMKSMMGGTYRENVRKSLLPEFISMNFMMAGMAPVMACVVPPGVTTADPRNQ
jgi:hypothetical protein